jgi:hypothetical protein
MADVDAVREQEAKDREIVARWMVEMGLATGHGDTLEDLLKEATWQIKEKWLKT